MSRDSLECIFQSEKKYPEQSQLDQYLTFLFHIFLGYSL